MTIRLTNTSATRRLDFNEVPGYKPTIGGLRHLSRESRQPPDGTIVELVDGDLYKVSSHRKSPAVYDCHVCGEVYLAEQQPPPEERPRQVVPSPRRRRPYIDGTR